MRYRAVGMGCVRGVLPAGLPVALSAVLLWMLFASAGAARAETARPVKIVCFGDSITGHRPGEPYLDKYLKWTDVLGAMVEAKTGAGAAVVNRGFAGDKTYPEPRTQTPGGIARLKADILDEKPDIAVILLGGNDAKKSEQERARTRENLEKIVRETRAAGIKVLLLQYAVLGPASGPETAPATRPGAQAAATQAAADKTWYHLAGNNALIAEVAEKLDVPTLALQGAFDAAAKTAPRAELVNTVDGVHLAPRGELVMARAVFARLVELGWVK